MAISPAVFAAATEIPKMAFSIAQIIQGNKALKGLEDPGFEIPREARMALDMTRAMMGQTEMAGYTEAKDRISQIAGGAGQQAALYAGSAPGAVGAMQGIAGEQMMAESGLDIANAEWNQDMANRYTGALSEYADWVNKEQAYKQRRYEQKVSAASGLAGAGWANLMGSTSNVGGVFANQQAMKADQDFWKTMLGEGDTASATFTEEDKKKLLPFIEAIKKMPL